MGLGLNGALEGRNCLRGIIGDSGTFHLRCLGVPWKVLEPASRDPRQFRSLRHNSFIQTEEKLSFNQDQGASDKLVSDEVEVLLKHDIGWTKLDQHFRPGDQD